MDKRETKVEISDHVIKKGSKFVLFLKSCFHVIFVLHHYFIGGCGVYFFFQVTEEQLKEPLILRAKTYFPAFFTIWNFSFQTTFLCLALTYDIMQWLDKEGSKIGKRIKYLRDIIFNGLVFPFTCFVHCMFWAVYFIDRELVFPKVYDQILPWWLNHCVHTNIMIVLIVETILTSRRYPADVKVERIFYVFINISYALVFYSIYFFAGCWLYGVFGVMNWWQVCIYQAFISGSSVVFYHMAFFFNRLIHSPQGSEEITKPNGDIETKDISNLGGIPNGNGMKIACVENLVGDKNILKDNFVGEVNENGEKVNGKVSENGKDWAHENGVEVTNGIEVIEVSNGTAVKNGDVDNEVAVRNENGGVEDNGNIEDSAFEKSWSTKYRSNRNQMENSSL